MTDFRVSHDTRRQTDSSAVRFEQCGWKLLAQFVVERGGGESDGVAVSGGRVTPPDDYDQRERSAFYSQPSTLHPQKDTNQESQKTKNQSRDKHRRPKRSLNAIERFCMTPKLWAD